MAFYHNGILGRVSGSLAQLNFADKKHFNLIRKKRSNSRFPASESQLKYRGAFSLYNELRIRIRYQVTDIYLVNDLIEKNKQLIFFKYNLFNSTALGLVDYSRLNLSIGDLYCPVSTNATFVANPRSLNLYYSPDYDDINSFANDFAHIMIYNETLNEFAFESLVYYRGQGLVKCLVPLSWLPTHSAYIYHWFSTSTGARRSQNLSRKLN